MKFPAWTDEQMERIISWLLVVGVSLSALVTIVGGILYLYHYHADLPNYSAFLGEPSDLRTVPGILARVAAGRARGIIQFGLLLLIATPIARVIFSAFAFARQRDLVYVIVTLIVLSVLLYSLSAGGL